MSDAPIILTDRIPLPTLTDQLGYKDERRVREKLDAAGVPYIVIKRVRQYKPADVRAGFDSGEKLAGPRGRGRPRKATG